MKHLLLISAFAIFGLSASYGQKIYPTQEGTGRYGNWGFKDSLDKLVIPYKYSGAGFFEEGLAPVTLHNKSGYIDITGKEVIALMYDNAMTFENGMAAVKQKDKWGFIDKTGKQVVPFAYEDAEAFHEGLAAVKRKGKWGYINKSGKQVIPFAYEYAGYFLQGLAAVQPQGGEEKGFINAQGEMVIPAQFSATTGFNPDGTARVLKAGVYEWYSIDKTGKVATPNAPATATQTKQCISGNCNNGTGMYKDSRYVYEGQFKNGMPHGKGRLLKTNGDLYEGSFEYGMYNGQGTLYGADSSAYTGSFHQGVKQGKGSIIYADGRKYEGMFCNGQPQTDKASVNDLPFYSGIFRQSQASCEAVFAKFDLENNVAITQDYMGNGRFISYGTFDLNTGTLFNQTVNFIYTPLMPENYTEAFAATGQKQHAVLDFVPPLQKNDVSLNETFGARDITGTDYYIINAAIKCAGKNKDAPQRYEIRCYQLYTDGKVQKVSDRAVDFPYESKVHAVSPDGSCLVAFNSSTKEYRIYSKYLKQSIILSALPAETYPAVFDNQKMWFSSKNDSLYHLGKGMLLSVYDAATGKLVRSRQYSNNRISGGKLQFAALTDNQLTCVVISDEFTFNLWESIEDNRLKATNLHRKVYVLRLEDPDYLLPLVHPSYKRENYAAVSASTYEEYSKRKEELEAKRKAEAKRREEEAAKYKLARDQQRGIKGLLDEDEDDYISKPANFGRKKRTYLTQADMDGIIKSNSSSTSSGESGWDRYFRERERQSNIDYKKKNDGYRGY